MLQRIASLFKTKPPGTPIEDPGDGGAIPIDVSGACPLVTTEAGGETRTLAAPNYAGQVLVLNFKTDGGDCVITASAHIEQAGSSTVLTFEDAGDNLVLIGGQKGDDLVWRVLANDGITTS